MEPTKNEDFNDEDELEYVELEDPREQIIQKRRYLDEPSKPSYLDPDNYNDINDVSDQNSYQPTSSYEKKDFVSKSRSVSRRPNSNPEAPLDVEPLDLKPKNQSKIDDPIIPLDGNELEDPW